MNTSPKNRLGIGGKRGIALATVIAVLVAGIGYSLHRTRRASEQQPSAPTQQQIDLGLSLFPASALSAKRALDKGVRRTKPPAPPAGCRPVLAFKVTAGDPRTAGTVGYAITAANQGSVACTDATLSVYYAENEAFVSAEPAPRSAGYYWVLGTLAPGDQRTIRLKTSRDAALAEGASTSQACLASGNGSDACGMAAADAALPAPVPAGSSTAPAAPVAAFDPGAREFGVWVWTPLEGLRTDELRSIVSRIAAGGFNAAYVTIDDYLEIAALPEGPTKVARLKAYQDTLSAFIGMARQEGVVVDAEAGHRDWGEVASRWKAYAILDFVAAYNASHANAFRGVQYDVEPYLLPAYEGDKASVLQRYLEMVDELTKRNAQHQLRLGIVVPHFYDATQAWTPQVTVAGTRDYAYGHLVRMLRRVRGGKVLVMAYRNFAEGDGGSIALSRAEVGAANGTGVAVIVAQEAGDVDPAYVTFYGTSRAAMFGELARITSAFGGEQAFGGTAVNYLEPFEALR